MGATLACICVVLVGVVVRAGPKCSSTENAMRQAEAGELSTALQLVSSRGLPNKLNLPQGLLREGRGWSCNQTAIFSNDSFRCVHVLDMALIQGVCSRVGDAVFDIWPVCSVKAH